jgi:hypothetical protein
MNLITRFYGKFVKDYGIDSRVKFYRLLDDNSSNFLYDRKNNIEQGECDGEGKIGKDVKIEKREGGRRKEKGERRKKKRAG